MLVAPGSVFAVRVLVVQKTKGEPLVVICFRYGRASLNASHVA